MTITSIDNNFVPQIIKGEVSVIKEEYYASLASILGRWADYASKRAVRAHDYFASAARTDPTLLERIQLSELYLVDMHQQVADYCHTQKRQGWSDVLICHTDGKPLTVALVNNVATEIRLEALAAKPNHVGGIEAHHMHPHGAATLVIKCLSKSALLYNKPISVTASPAAGTFFLRLGFDHISSFEYILTPQKIAQLNIASSVDFVE